MSKRTITDHLAEVGVGVDDYFQAIYENRNKKVVLGVPHGTPSGYKLGQVIANDVKYWGKELPDGDHTAASFICPECEEEFRTRVTLVRTGKIFNCGCKRKKK